MKWRGTERRRALERDRDLVTRRRKRGKKCAMSRQMHRPWEIRLRYHIVIAAGYICRSVGRSAGQSVAVGPNGKEKTRYILESKTVKTVAVSSTYLYILRNISDTQIIINIISSSSSSCSSVIGATSLRVRNTFTTWMIPYSMCDTCVGFQFSLIIQGDLPNPYFFIV